MSIKEIQKKIGVTVDGKVGPDTTKKAWTAYFDNKLNDTDMAELNIDTDVPPQSEYVPEGLDANKYYQWVPPLKIGQKIEVKKPEDTEPMAKPEMIQSVPKVEKEDDTDTVTFKPPKSGIMALLDPYDSPDYMGSRLYLKNERENYAKAIGNTPLTGKYWEDKDYSNDDVKDLLDSAMEDVKTQEAMKNAMEDRKSTATSNIRAITDQNLQAANALSGELIEAERNDNQITTSVQNNEREMTHADAEMKRLRAMGVQVDNEGRAIGDSVNAKLYNQNYDTYWTKSAENNSLEASRPNVAGKEARRQQLFKNAEDGAKLLGIDFGEPMALPNMAQPNMAQPNMAQPKVSSTQTNMSQTNQGPTSETTSQYSKVKAPKKYPKKQPQTEYTDEALLTIATAPNYSSYVSDNTSSTGKANAEISKDNFNEKKKWAEVEIIAKINGITSPEALDSMYKIYGNYFPEYFKKRMEVYKDKTDKPSLMMIRKYSQITTKGK